MGKQKTDRRREDNAQILYELFYMNFYMNHSWLEKFIVVIVLRYSFQKNFIRKDIPLSSIQQWNLLVRGYDVRISHRHVFTVEYKYKSSFRSKMTLLLYSAIFYLHSNWNPKIKILKYYPSLFKSLTHCKFHKNLIHFKSYKVLHIHIA